MNAEDLSLVPVEELLEEVARRYEHACFVGGNKRGDFISWKLKWKGGAIVTSGLMARAQHEIQEYIGANLIDPDTEDWIERE